MVHRSENPSPNLTCWVSCLAQHRGRNREFGSSLQSVEKLSKLSDNPVRGFHVCCCCNIHPKVICPHLHSSPCPPSGSWRVSCMHVCMCTLVSCFYSSYSTSAHTLSRQKERVRVPLNTFDWSVVMKHKSVHNKIVWYDCLFKDYMMECGHYWSTLKVFT